MSIRKLGKGREPSWSPDGNKIIYTYNEKIYIYNLITKDTEALPVKGKNPRYSPEGGHILYSQNGINKYSLTLKKADVLSPFGDHPLWNSDGATIIFSFEGDVWRMASDGERRELFIPQGIPRALSSDSSSLLIERWDEEFLQFNLVLVDMDDGSITPLLNGYQGSFSPDDRIMVFSADGIFLHERELKKTIKLVARGFAPSWSPTGDMIVFCDKGFLWLIESVSSLSFD
ncbi:MAG: TolB family protein [bacterium]